ncbi:MAG TPA: amidohydrolase family protein [Anaerolineales bacterium]|nr:amidohydrolase family protein [Anaerolineales bacterium]
MKKLIQTENRTIDLLLVNGTVIPMDAERRIISDGAVAIDQGRIVAVGTTQELEGQFQAEKVLDCRNQVVLPGLVDAHGHGGHSLLKTIASDTPSFWSKIMTRTYHHFTTPNFWYVEGKLSALERLKAGITCGLSVIGSEPRSDDPIFANQHAQAYAETGVREVVAVGPCNPPWPHRFSTWHNDRQSTRLVEFEQAMQSTAAVIETWNHGAGGRIRVYVTPFLIVPSLDSSGPTAPDIAPELTAHDRLQSRRVREIASQYQTRIHSDAFGGMVSLAAMDEYGLIGPDVSLQHCNGLSLAEVQILADTDTRVGHMPGTSQAKARTPVPELIEAGVTVAVVSDGTSPKTPFDLLQAARKAQLVNQLLLKDAFILPAGKLLEMITIDAARAIGWDDEIGSLEPGKKADVITIDMNQPHLAPFFMPVHRLIYEASGQDVSTVIVDGKILMQNRQVTSVNEIDVLQAAQEEAVQIIDRAGLRPHMQIEPTFWGKSRLTFEHRRWFPEDGDEGQPTGM